MPNFPGLGALGMGLAHGLEQGDKYNLAQTELGFKRTTMDRQLRQEQMKMLSEVLKRIDEDPETTLTALQDPNFAAQLGMSPNAYMSFLNTAKSKAEEVQHSRELLSLYGSNQLLPEHLEKFKRGIPRTVAANKDFATYLDTQDLERAGTHITTELARVADPDARRRALPGIIAGYKGTGGPGRAQRASDKLGIMNTLGGGMSGVEDAERRRSRTEALLAQAERLGLTPAQVLSELGLLGVTAENVGMIAPKAGAYFNMNQAESTATGKRVGDAKAGEIPVLFPPDGSDAQPLTVSQVEAQQAGDKALAVAQGTTTGRADAYGLPSRGGQGTIADVLLNYESRKAEAGQPAALKSSREASARLDNARAAAAELAADDKNIAAAKKLVDAMSTAAIAKHILKSLPPDQAAELEQWYKKAQELIRTSGVTQGSTLPPRPVLGPPNALPGQNGAVVPRQAPAGGSRNGWNIQRVN